MTAIGTNELNERLKEENNFEVIGNDIPYQDGLIDVLKGNSDIEIVILSEVLTRRL